jgi:hypothetical protein
MTRKKKPTASLICSPAAEYLTFVAASGTGVVEAVALVPRAPTEVPAQPQAQTSGAPRLIRDQANQEVARP